MVIELMLSSSRINLVWRVLISPLSLARHRG